MEALQILKFIYKKERLDFSAGRKTTKEKKHTTILSLGRFLKIFENESRKHTCCKVWVTGFISQGVMLLS
jgi:hypothetical protein